MFPVMQLNFMFDMASKHYDKKYFAWQVTHGEFGGWANRGIFIDYISHTDAVLDFGCGGGFLLRELNCNKKLGIEVNPAAIEYAQKIGIEVFINAEDVPDDFVDVIISNHALEHSLQPLKELKTLYKKLKVDGKIVFTVPCESITCRYKPNDINNHLYSWSPMCIGNLFKEAGFSIIESKPYFHKWPPNHRIIALIAGKRMFDIACRIFGLFFRSRSQVRVIAEKKIP